MSTLSWISDVAVKTADEAIKLMFEEGKRSVVLYNSNEKTLSAEIKKFYEEIKKKNSTIEDINQQTLPTNPYYWRDIDGCLAVQCAEISSGTFEHNADGLAMFSGWNYSVLSDPTARKGLSTKAMTTLAMLGHMAAGNY